MGHHLECNVGEKLRLHSVENPLLDVNWGKIAVGLTNRPSKTRMPESAGLPRFEAIIVALTDNLAVLELEKHGGVGTHLRTDRETPKGEC